MTDLGDNDQFIRADSRDDVNGQDDNDISIANQTDNKYPADNKSKELQSNPLLEIPRGLQEMQRLEKGMEQLASALDPDGNPSFLVVNLNDVDQLNNEQVSSTSQLSDLLYYRGSSFTQWRKMMDGSSQSLAAQTRPTLTSRLAQTVCFSSLWLQQRASMR